MKHKPKNMDTITWEDFSKLELRVGTILEAQDFPEAIRPAYKLRIDFGDYGIKSSSAQITDLYNINELVGMQVIAVTNLSAKQIGPFISECLVTGFYNSDNKVVLAVPEKDVDKGALLT